MIRIVMTPAQHALQKQAQDLAAQIPRVFSAERKRETAHELLEIQKQSLSQFKDPRRFL